MLKDLLNQESIRNNLIKRLSKFQIQNGDNNCWNWNGAKSSAGYPITSISINKFRVSHVMLILNGKFPTEEKDCALHTCDNPECTNPNHLFWGSKKDNTQDMLKKNRGSKPPVLTRDKTNRCYIKTKEDIDRLAKLCETMSISEIAKVYNKKYSAMCALLSKLGLKSKINMRGVNCAPPRKPSRFEEPYLENKLIEFSKTMTVLELSKYFNCKTSTIYTQLKRLNIKPLTRRRFAEKALFDKVD